MIHLLSVLSLVIVIGIIATVMLMKWYNPN